MSMKELVEVSRRYGSDPEYVLAGGGNTSWKTDDALFVKASGTALATIQETGFVELDLKAVRAILRQAFPSDSAAREAQVLSALMAARKPGQTMRPSVETILHALFPYAYVVHLHPALVNGVLCSVKAEETIGELFGDQVLYVPYTTPGYVLSKTLSDSFETWTAQGKPFPSIVFLQNHGIFVAADSVQEVDKIYSMVFDRIRSRIARTPDFSAPESTVLEKSTNALFDEAAKLKDALAKAASHYVESPCIEFETNKEILRHAASASDFASLNGAFSPDHIVYAGARPLYIPHTILDAIQEGAKTDTVQTALAKQIDSFIAQEGTYPHVIVVQDVGAFGLAKNTKAAQLALMLFNDAIKVSVYSMNFGGPHFMGAADVDFIKKWEVEQYRSTVSA